MDTETQARLVKRVFQLLDDGTTDREESGSSLPASIYVDEARHAREVDVLFRRLPLPIVHASVIADEGAFVTHDLSGVPVLVVRGAGGGVSAFLNVCRHRGARLEEKACGTRKAFACPYHGWTYGLDGRLLHIPHADGFGHVDPGSRPLVRIPAEEAFGFVWARLCPLEPGESASLDVASWLGPVGPDLEGFGIPTAHVYSPRLFTKEMNWKLVVDVFLESYHFKSAHRDTSYPMFFDNLAIAEALGPHARNIYPKRSIRGLAAEPERGWELRRHALIVYHLFPGTILLVVGDHAAVVHAWPDGPGRSRCESYTLVPKPPTADRVRAYWDRNNAILYGTTDEDFAMGESVQRGMRSGANSDVVLGAFEHGLRHFHAEIERRIG
jgi:phenylpropionate dioxygenase-like ring-hydroxylating dioxygenase large terminal subunit